VPDDVDEKFCGQTRAGDNVRGALVVKLERQLETIQGTANGVGQRGCDVHGPGEAQEVRGPRRYRHTVRRPDDVAIDVQRCQQVTADADEGSGPNTLRRQQPYGTARQDLDVIDDEHGVMAQPRRDGHRVLVLEDAYPVVPERWAERFRWIQGAEVRSDADRNCGELHTNLDLHAVAHVPTWVGRLAIPIKPYWSRASGRYP